MEVQMLNGTLLESAKTNGVSRVKGFLGADQTVALRWQGKITEVARKVLLTVDSTIGAQVTPGVVKYTSQFHYEIVQGNAAQLTLALPATQALTRLVGEQIRDWHTTTDGGRQTLTIEFIKPVEKNYALTLYSEQPVEGAGANASLNPPQPLEVERESGALTVSAEDTLVEVESLAGLRQVNAPDKAIAAFPPADAHAERGHREAGTMGGGRKNLHRLHRENEVVRTAWLQGRALASGRIGRQPDTAGSHPPRRPLPAGPGATHSGFAQGNRMGSAVVCRTSQFSRTQR
jgi:hypothetical protein